MKKTLLLLFVLPLIVFSQQQTTGTKFSEPDFTIYFQEAYQQNPTIPRGILEAVAYGNTHIYHIVHNSGEEGNCMGMPMAYGVMGLTLDGKNYFNNNLVYISNLSGISTEEIINSPKNNILAYAKAFNTIMSSISSQKAANKKNSDIIFNTLIALSELPHEDEGQTFALNTQLYSYLTFMNSPEFQEKYNFPAPNFDLQTLFGEDNFKVLSSSHVTVSDEEISDDEGNVYKSLGNNNAPSLQSTDYPAAIWNAAASCNFSSRTQAVTAIVIHDVEGSYASCISWFKNCSAGVSAHYIVRSSDGQITQMVLESKKAWHVGNANGYTIGIEHEGYNTQTGWYTAAMYQSSANLVKDICASGYGINKTTCWSGASCNGICVLPSAYKIKGHQHYPNQTHNDPGVNWNWGTYYNLINNTSTACGTPSGLNANLITSTSATLNWSSVSGASSYNIEYKPSSSSTWTTLNSTTTSESISGLTVSTSYDFKVQAVCSNAGSYSSVATFSTTATSGSNDNCANATALFPNTSCITTSGNVAGATAGGLAKASCDAFSGTPALKDVWFEFVATSSIASIKVSPSVSFDAVLALYSSCTGGPMGCSDNGGGPGAAETINTISLVVGSTYYIRVYSYGANVPATTTFTICIISASNPFCGTPSGLSTTSVTTSGATLSWTAVPGASSYDVQYKETGTSTWTTVTSNSTSLAICGLNPSTTYQFQVQAFCTVTGTYSQAATFITSNTPPISNDDCSSALEIFTNTSCIPSTGNVADATASGLPKAGCDAYSGTPALKDVWFKFVATNSAATIKVSPSANFDAVLALYSSCSSSQIGCSDNGGGPGTTETIITSTLTIGTTYYIRVYCYGASTPATTSFDICIISAIVPSCGTPSGLSASSVTSDSAEINWTAVSGANSYNIQYKLSSSSSWTTSSTTTTSIALGGLNASSLYQYKVQAVCSSSSAYSPETTFTTAADTSTNSIIEIGNGTSPYSAHPYGTVYMDERVQYIFKKNELTAAGWSPLSPYLKSISFYVSSAAQQPLGNFKITMAHTNGSTFSSTSFLSGTNSVEVYQGTVTAAQGWNTYTFSTSFHYDGTSNLLVSICWDNNSYSANSAVLATSYSNYVALYYRADLSTSDVCGKTVGIQSYYRPNSKLEFSSTTMSSMVVNPEELSLDVNSPANESGFELYPNPLSGGVLYGKFIEPVNKKMTLKFYDLLGRELISKEVTIEEGNFSLSFDYENLKTGTYMVVGLTDTSRFTKRVVVR